ncbi:hypothetical protein [Actinoplanes xinjiangensis]|uniref:Uncharacterized protein n=1 Tax=Actinoplanes xinjiangensis TaxID=512350 RepID=A0A316EPP2_9ACTN|nr:hypothetical protein [Actinoplanes xinjiangensis]PWK33277.1 hypothetical protein BC793_12867 [Actinoplanes xinjiangensis]GIF43484.1 hypothetical protein Axi01nite_77950 [Actinoplanes xinjiangensis]
MSRRASGILLFVLSIPPLLLGISAGKDANHEAGVHAGQLRQAATVADAAERERFTYYAESTLRRLEDARYNRNMLLVAAAAGLIGGIVVLATGRGRREVPAPGHGEVPATARDETGPAAGAVDTAPPAPAFTSCQACQWKISVAATACPQCGHPHQPVTTVAAASPPPAPAGKGLRAFYGTLIALGLGGAAVIYTVLFDSLSETELVRLSPFWLFPAVFGYYGLVAQRMEAQLQESHLDTVSDQLLSVIRETGVLGQVLAFLIHAPFLLVKSRQPWVTALVGSLIWAIALALFFSLVFPSL